MSQERNKVIRELADRIRLSKNDIEKLTKLSQTWPRKSKANQVVMLLRRDIQMLEGHLMTLMSEISHMDAARRHLTMEESEPRRGKEMRTSQIMPRIRKDQEPAEGPLQEKSQPQKEPRPGEKPAPPQREPATPKPPQPEVTEDDELIASSEEMDTQELRMEDIAHLERREEEPDERSEIPQHHERPEGPAGEEPPAKKRLADLAEGLPREVIERLKQEGWE